MVPSSRPTGHPSYLDPLFHRHALHGPAERDAFAALWAQHVRHAPLFGTADHPDLDPEHLDVVRHAACADLAEQARRGRRDAVRISAVRQLLRAMRTAGGLRAVELEPGLLALLRSAARAIADQIGAAHVPLVEAFAAHPSLVRHYRVDGAALAELIRWTLDLLGDDDPPSWALRFVARCRQTAPPRGPRAADPAAPPRFAPPLVRGLQRLGDPPCPVELAALAGISAPRADDAPGAGGPVAQRWAQLLAARLDAAGIAEAGLEQVGEVKALPGLVQSALIAHALGLEDRGHKAVLADATDRVVLHRLVPIARAVGGRNNRHEPIAGYLTNALAPLLRPWSFDAPPLTTEQRAVVIALLAELATGKARKLLHQEKKHAALRAEPERIRRAVNRGLARWSDRQQALAPRERVVRVAAGLRYLNRVRRGTDPRVRDAAVVAELLG